MSTGERLGEAGSAMACALRLLMEKPVRLARSKWGKEDVLTEEVADMLRSETLSGNLKCVWTHIPNEGMAARSKAQKIQAINATNKKRALGMIKGAPDFVLGWGDSAGFIELKSDKGRLSDAQEAFLEWAYQKGCHTAVCRSLNEVRTALFEWGVLATQCPTRYAEGVDAAISALPAHKKAQVYL